MFREHQDVVGTLAKRRNRDGKDRKTEVEVFAELTRRDGGLQMPVGRRDDADVHLQRDRAAQPLEALFLQGAKDLRLQRQRQVADFVEKQRTAMGHLELAGLAGRSAGKRPFLVAEELGLQQRFRDCGTVDRDKRAVRARTERMECPRKQFLARAALAFEEHRGVRCRGPMERDRDLLQFRILADDLGRATARRELLLEENVLGRHAPLRERTLHHQQQMIGIDRLGEKVERAVLDGLDGVLNRAVRRHHHNRELGIQLFGGPQDAEAVALGKPQVRQNDPRARRSQDTDGFGLVARFDHAVAVGLERMAEHGAQGVLVFDEQDRGIGGAAGHV